MKRLNVVGGLNEALLPKSVGLLLFNDEPQHFFPLTRIDVVWIPEGEAGDRFDEKSFTGPLGHITRAALSYIQSNYLKETVLKHGDRPEAERFWNFPYSAVEEAVVNAVYHRSVEIREPVEFRISPEELVALSFPGPDRSIRMEELRLGKAVNRRYRNRRIGEFLKELELTEGRSTGISRILREMKENGSPSPEFETDEERSYFLVRLPAHASSESVPRTGSEKCSGKSSGKILAEMRRNPEVTIPELALALGISTRAVEKRIASLRDGGKIERVGPAKGGHWKVVEE